MEKCLTFRSYLRLDVSLSHFKSLPSERKACLKKIIAFNELKY